jgi:hypothetical protein
VAVFGSKHSSVCAMRAVRAAVCGSAIGSVRQYVAVCGSASAHGAVSVCSALCVYIHTQSHLQYIFPYRGNGNEPNIPCILIVRDRNRSVQVLNTN